MKPPSSSPVDALPRDLIARLQADCSALLGSATLTFGADGRALTDLYTASPYCRMIASAPGGHSRCVQSRRDLAMEAIETGRSQEAHCHAGVWMLAVPLILSGEAVAASVVSLRPGPDERDVGLETSQTLQIDSHALLEAARRIPALTPERLKSAVRLLEDLHRTYALLLSRQLEAEKIRRQMTQAASRAQALYHTSRAISSTLSLDQTVRILVEQMALAAGLDRCIIALRVPGRDELKPAGAYGLSPSDAQKFHSARRLDLGVRPEWWDRLERGKVVLLPHGWLSHTDTKNLIPVPADRRAMLVPVQSGGTLWAVAYMDGTRHADALTQQEVDLTLAIAGQAGIAIGNITRYEQEQRVARTLQESMLQPIPEEVEGYSVGSLYLPALAEAQVGGDFFDLVPLKEGRFAVFLGDVSGKGIEAAVHTGMMKYMARGLIVDDPHPSTLVSRLNRAVSAQNALESGFITFFYALVDSEHHRIYYTNAGHEPPLLYHAFHGESKELPPNGPAIGLLDDFEYPQEERLLSEGDCVLVYTDGAVEARNDTGAFFGVEELKKALHRSMKKDGPGLVSSLHNDLLQFTGGGLQDDLALLALKRPI